MSKKQNIRAANTILQNQKPDGVKSWGKLKEKGLLVFEELRAGSRTKINGKNINIEWRCVLNFLGSKFVCRSVRKQDAEDAVAKQFVEHFSSSPPN
jgi:hypothetical protein